MMKSNLRHQNNVTKFFYFGPSTNQNFWLRHW